MLGLHGLSGISSLALLKYLSVLWYALAAFETQSEDILSTEDCTESKRLEASMMSIHSSPSPILRLCGYCADFLVTVFRRYPEHHSSIFNEIVTTIVPSLPAAKANYRSLVDQTQHHQLHPFSALILRLVQVCNIHIVSAFKLKIWKAELGLL